MIQPSDAVEISGLFLSARTELLLLHSSTDKSFSLVTLSRKDKHSYNPQGYEMVSTLQISDFYPYFQLYETELQEGLLAEIIQLVKCAGMLGHHYRKAKNNPLPRAFKRLARKLISCYHKYGCVDFLTHTFVSKIYGLVRQIWRDYQTYHQFEERSRKLRARLRASMPVEMYQFEC